MGIELPPGLQVQLDAAAQQQQVAQVADQWRQAMGLRNGGTYDVRTLAGQLHEGAVLEEVVLSIGPMGVRPIAAKIIAGDGLRLMLPWHAVASFVERGT